MRTDWYSGKQHPIREGWYERDYSKAEGFFAHDGQTIFLDLWLQADSGNGYWYVDEPKGQINDAWWENLPWRGLTSNDRVEGRDAASSRTVPLDAVVGGLGR